MAAARRCAKPRYGSFMTSSADGNRRAGPELDELPSPRLDGDQAGRCDGNLPFASRLMALLSMTGHWAGQAFVDGAIPFFGRSSNGGFALRKVENALFFIGD